MDSGLKSADWVGLALVLALATPLYLLLAAQNLTVGEDSAHYLVAIAADSPGWHPNHLLFEPAAWAFMRGIEAFGVATTPLQAVAILNGVAGVLNLALVYLITLGLVRSPFAAAVAAGVLGVSFAHWHYATIPDTYILPLTFGLAALAVLQRDLLRRPEGPRSPVATVAIAVLASAAVLLHQQYLFLGVVLFAALVACDWGRGRRLVGLPASAVVYAGICVVALGLTYVSVYAAMSGSADLSGMTRWARGHSHSGLWDTSGLAKPVKAVVGLGLTVFSLYFIFLFDATRTAAESLFPDKALYEEIFLVEQTVAPIAAVLGIAGMATALAALGVLIFGPGGLLRGTGAPAVRAQPGARAFLWVLVAHAAVMAAVVTVWEPLNIEFWIVVVAALAVLFAVRVSWERRAIRRAALAFVLGVGVSNLAVAIVPLSRPEGDFWRVATAPVVEATGARDLVIAECPYICRGYIELFAVSELAVPSREDFESVLARADAADGGERANIVVSSWAFDPPQAALSGALQAQRDAFMDDLSAWLGGTRLEPVREGAIGLWRIERDPQTGRPLRAQDLTGSAVIDLRAETTSDR